MSTQREQPRIKARAACREQTLEKNEARREEEAPASRDHDSFVHAGSTERDLRSSMSVAMPES